jgi:hypothetical protein
MEFGKNERKFKIKCTLSPYFAGTFLEEGIFKKLEAKTNKKRVWGIGFGRKI